MLCVCTCLVTAAAAGHTEERRSHHTLFPHQHRDVCGPMLQNSERPGVFMCVQQRDAYSSPAFHSLVQTISASMARAKCYHTMDAFVKLVVVLVRYSGDVSNTVTKVNLLNKVKSRSE